MYKSLVFGDEFLAQGLNLKSHQRCSAGIRTRLSADQSSSSTVTVLVKGDRQVDANQKVIY